MTEIIAHFLFRAKRLKYNILYLLPSDNDTYKMFFWIQELNAYKEVNNTNNDYIKNEIKKLTPNFSLDENGDLYIEYP